MKFFLSDMSFGKDHFMISAGIFLILFSNLALDVSYILSDLKLLISTTTQIRQP